MQTAMYNSVVIPNTNTGNPQGCYYYAPSYDGNNNVHGSPMGHNGHAQHQDGGNVDRTYYQSHGTAPIQQRTMLSPDLAPDLQCVGSDVPFYDSTDVVKKELNYYEMQPIQSQSNNNNQYNTNNLLSDFFQNGNNNDISDFWEMTPSFQYNPPNQWSKEEVLDFLMAWSKSTSVDLIDINMRQFNGMDGQTFCSLTQTDFYTLDPQYGLSIYKSLQNEIANHYQPSQIVLDLPQSIRSDNNNTLPDFHTWNNTTFSQLLSVVGPDIQGNSPSSSHDSDREDRESTSSSMSTANEKPTVSSAAYITSSLCSEILDSKKAGRRGRPPKTEARSSRSRQGKGNGKLWEFIRDLLLDPATNPSLIRWERPEDGIFKFVQSDRVAKMWGDRKQNPRMTYEKLSRAMRTYYTNGYLRHVKKTEGLPKKLIYQFGPNATGWFREKAYYYKSQVLLPVFGRRLVYKFGPNATGWRHGPGYH